MAVTIKRAIVWLSDLTSRVAALSVVSDDNPYVGCDISALLAESEIPVAFATVHPGEMRYEAVYGFNSQEDLEAALKLITGGGISEKKNSAPRKMRRVA